jgi:phosphoglycolate phosphatase
MHHNHYDHIIFDLDGTLTDSRKGIFNAARFMIKELSLKLTSDDDLSLLIGPPLQAAIQNLFSVDGEKLNTAVKIFRDYYARKGIYENELYPGIDHLLKDLVESGIHLYLATSKYELFAKQVLHHFAISGFFTDIAGADYQGSRSDKDMLVLTLFQRNGLKDAERIVLVGDSRYDIEAAAFVGIESVGVTYGFSSYTDMQEFNPDYLVQSVDELRRLLIRY